MRGVKWRQGIKSRARTLGALLGLGKDDDGDLDADLLDEGDGEDEEDSFVKAAKQGRASKQGKIQRVKSEAMLDLLAEKFQEKIVEHEELKGMRKAGKFGVDGEREDGTFSTSIGLGGGSSLGRSTVNVPYGGVGGGMSSMGGTGMW